MVDSRIYEYLIPTHSFLPPHPRSFMGRKCEEWSIKKGEHEQWKHRQKEVEGYWNKVDDEVIRPILEEHDEQTRSILEKALYLHGDDIESADEPVDSLNNSTAPTNKEPTQGILSSTESGAVKIRSSQITEAIKRLRAAYLAAKRAYRIPPGRLARIRDCLSCYVGTKNYHNFTIDKTFRDPSAKRVMKSFVVNGEPLLINGSEWLSLKVHGQSFMMHQIRKMVGMVALVVRCGCDPKRIVEAMGPDSISIPKAPSLGLLLERPVFDSYNKRAASDLGKEAIDFDKFKAEMDEFKQKQIYERIYRDEEKDNVFGNFFNHVDNFPEPTFLYVTSGGVEATTSKDEDGVVEAHTKKKLADAQGESETEGEEEVEDDKLGAEG
jgi:tRNA pseudouridine38-40 synthase